MTIYAKKKTGIWEIKNKPGIFNKNNQKPGIFSNFYMFNSKISI